MVTVHQQPLVNALRTLRHLRGHTADYDRNEQRVEVTVIPHTTERNRERDGNHFEQRRTEQTWLLEAVELQPLADDLGITRLLPEPGDELIFAADTAAEYRCQLVAPAPGEPAAKPHDAAGVFWCLNTHLLQPEIDS